MPLSLSTRHAVTLVAVGLAAIVAAAGCSANEDRSKSLAYSLKDYNESVRWKQFRTAATFVDPAISAKMMRKLRKATTRLDMTDVELVEMNVSPDGASAICLVQFSWYEADNLTLRKGFELQDWLKVDKRWLLMRNYASDDPNEPATPFAER